jgi:hypothetical protein
MQHPAPLIPNVVEIERADDGAPAQMTDHLARGHSQCPGPPGLSVEGAGQKSEEVLMKV